MVLKIFGAGLVGVGLAHAAAGVLELVADARADALLGLGLIVAGAALFGVGSILQALETRRRGGC